MCKYVTQFHQVLSSSTVTSRRLCNIRIPQSLPNHVIPHDFVSGKSASHRGVYAASTEMLWKVSKVTSVVFMSDGTIKFAGFKHNKQNINH